MKIKTQVKLGKQIFEIEVEKEFLDVLKDTTTIEFSGKGNEVTYHPIYNQHFSSNARTLIGHKMTINESDKITYKKVSFNKNKTTAEPGDNTNATN